MRHFILISMLVALWMGGCGRSFDPKGDDAAVTMGEVHTEFLTKLFDRIDSVGPNMVTGSGRESIAYEVANELAAEYGAKPFTMEEVREHIRQGREMAHQDPVALVQSVLEGDDLTWWNRFASEARVEDAREVFLDHCRRFGTPREGSVLSNLVDVSLSSAEFWSDYRGGLEPEFENSFAPMSLGGWKKKLLRFAVNVVVDGVSGSLASAGGGPIGGAIVGGLASYGADKLVFGDGLRTGH